MLSRIEKAKFSILWYFFAQGCVIGNWAAILPFVKDEQHISNGLLGIVLISAIGGALLALPIITYLNDHYGSGLSTIIGSILMLIFFPIVGINYHLGILIVGIFLLGFGAGCTDVSINGQAVLYEKLVKSSSLGMFHAMYAIGGLVGALLGGVIMGQLNTSVLEQTAICSTALLIPCIFIGFYLLTLQEEKSINQSKLYDYEQKKYEKLKGYTDEYHNINIDNESLLSNSFNSYNSNIDNTSNKGTSTTTTNSNKNTIILDSNYNPTTSHHSILSDVIKQRESNSNNSSNKLRESYSTNNNINIINSNTIIDNNTIDASLNHTETASIDWQVYELQLTSPNDSSYYNYITSYCCCCSSSSSCYSKYITLIEISMIGLIAYFGEGSIGDWSAIYLSDNLNASPIISCLGYVGFSLCVAFGRYFSDYFVEIIGRQLLLQYSGILSSIGLGFVVVGPWLTTSQTHSQIIAILGFSLCGLGISSVAPCVISLAGSHEISMLAGLKPAESIAYVTSIGYLGIMISPPLLGELSMWLTSLRWSYAVDAVVIYIIVIIASMIKKDVF